MSTDRIARMSALGDTASELRSFLEPLWMHRKSATGRLPDAGTSCSEGMCGFSASFMALALSALEGSDWRVAGGWPQSGGGMACPRRSLKAHFWTVSEDGIVVDLTADQFGHPCIIVTGANDPRYVESFTAEEIERHLPKVMPLAEEWLELASMEGIVPSALRLAA